jgi:hypothetical protein
VKLPEIEEGPVQESSSSFAGLNAAQKQAANTFEQGLSVFGQEMVKSQHNRAAADLLSGLESAQLDLRTKKTISTSDLRTALGPSFDSLPPEIKAQTTRQVLNPNTGEMESQERNDIPMFSVAGSIYDVRAKKALQDSLSHFSSSGWAADFADSAQREIVSQKKTLSLKAMEDAHNFLQEQDTTSAIDLANSGKFDLARQVIAGSNTMDLKHKVDLNGHVDKIEQTRPLYEALRTGDIGTMAKQLVALGDAKQFTKLSPQERDAFTNRLESEIKAFQDGLARADDQKLKANAESGWNGIFQKERQGVLPSYADIPMPGTVHATEQKEMIAYVDKLNKGERPETDMKLYAGLADLASKDRTKFTATNLLAYRNRLSDADFKHFVDLQVGLKGGNPEAYDHFQTTDEEINTQLGSKEYSIDAKDKGNAEKVGFIKTLVQHELAISQEQNNGKPLGLEERNGVIRNTLKANIDPRHDKWLFGMGTEGSHILGMEAGVDMASAATFQKAVSQLDPGSMSGIDSDSKVKALKKHYADYQKFEPSIERAWQVQRGKNISPDDAVRVWYWTKANYSRLEGALRKDGAFVQGDDALNNERITNLAVQEVLRKLGR